MEDVGILIPYGIHRYSCAVCSYTGGSVALPKVASLRYFVSGDLLAVIRGQSTYGFITFYKF